MDELQIPPEFARDEFVEIVEFVEKMARRTGVDAWMLLLALIGEPLFMNKGVCKLWVTRVPLNDEVWYFIHRDDDGKWYLIEAERDVLHCQFCSCAMDWVGAHSVEIPADVGARLKLVELLIRLSDKELKRRLKRFAYKLAHYGG